MGRLARAVERLDRHRRHHHLPAATPTRTLHALRQHRSRADQHRTTQATAPIAIGRARLHGGRHLVGLITAFRCPTCRHDTVLDPDGQQWNLDDTDYTDDGSWDNTSLIKSPNQ